MVITKYFMRKVESEGSVARPVDSCLGSDAAGQLITPHIKLVPFDQAYCIAKFCP